MIRLTVNGEARELAHGQTLADLVRAAGRDPRTVAIEHNGEIVKRERYESVVLAEGDRLEIVHFVQGG
jgi:sulfur carrier protein